MAKGFVLDEKEKDFAEVISASYEDLNKLEWLLGTSAIPEKVEREIYQRLHSKSYTEEEVNGIIEYLSNNQRCPIDSGFNYSQTDIKWKLKRF